MNLALALAAEPKLIVCDEITSALDTRLVGLSVAVTKVFSARIAIMMKLIVAQ